MHDQVTVEPELTIAPALITNLDVDVVCTVKFPEVEFAEHTGLFVKTVPKLTVIVSVLMVVGAAKLNDVGVANVPVNVTLGEFPTLGENEGVLIRKSLQVA